MIYYNKVLIFVWMVQVESFN